MELCQVVITWQNVISVTGIIVPVISLFLAARMAKLSIMKYKDDEKKDIELKFRSKLDTKVFEDFKIDNTNSHTEIKEKMIRTENRFENQHKILREDYQRGIDMVNVHLKDMVELIKKIAL